LSASSAHCCACFAGKLFYHIISTEAHRARQERDAQCYEQLQQSMNLTLAALADRLQRKLDAKTPDQVEAFKDKVREVRQRALQRRQQQQQQTNMRQISCQGPLQGVAAAAAVAAGQVQDAQLAWGGVAAAAAAAAVGGTVSAAAAAGASSLANPGGHLPPGLNKGTTTSSNGSRLAGHKRQHSSSNGSRWSDNVLWILHNYCLFHTSWSSSRSPAYNGQLLDQVAAELFGPSFRVRNSM
jgi:hypothetical protein